MARKEARVEIPEPAPSPVSPAANPAVQPKDILWIGGGKGGVGKSMVTLAALDYLIGKGERVLLIECDTSNPDVYKAYKDRVAAFELINLDEADGWVHFVNICDNNRENIVVVNSAARNNLSVSRFGETLGSSLNELGRRLVVLWVINRQRDSIELLKEFGEAMPIALIHVVRNGYFGAAEKFELYNQSKTREAIESAGGKTATFPDLADRVADEMYSRRFSILEASEKMALGNRAELGRWRREVGKMFGELMG